jgi:type I site-specific restriction-modification system R (restriction) subunit
MKNLKNLKRPVITLVIIFMAVAIFTNWKSSNKEEEAQQKIINAKVAEVKANQEMISSITDSINQLKKESIEKTKSYDKKIVAIKANIRNDKKQATIKNEKKLAELEQKNNDMIKRLSNYTESGTENLELFRYEMGREMNELGKSLTVSNI